MTGNGKCNLSNGGVYKGKYNEKSEEFALNVIERFDLIRTIEFFNKIGVYTYGKDEYIYPSSNQALTVAERLYDYCNANKVRFVNDCIIKKIDIKNNNIKTNKGDFSFDKIIIATGGITAKKTGSDGSGYNLCKSLGHSIISPKAVLCGLDVFDKKIKDISGVREKCTANLFIDGEFADMESGEVQFTDYGISGICIFNLSIKVAEVFNKNKKCSVEIKLLPGMHEDDLFDYLVYLKENNNFTLEAAINSVINKKIAKYICNIINIDKTALIDKVNDKILRKIAHTIKNLKFDIKAVHETDNAQSTLGGVPINEVNPDTLESLICKNVYFAGEVLDVTGKCGGYNLQFAWSSGHLASRLL